MDGTAVATQTGKTVFRFRIPISGEHHIEATAGGCADRMTIRRTEQPNAAYHFGTTGGVANWFDEADFDSSCYSIRDTLGALQANPQAAELVNAIMAKATASRGDVAKSASQNASLQKMKAAMSLQSLLKKAGENVFSAETVKQLNAALQKIKK